MQNFNSTYKPSPLGLQTASQLPLRHKAKEPDKFDGESIEWRDYIVHFEKVAIWNQWDDVEKAQQLLMSLRGPAQKLLSDLNPNLLDNYEYILSVLNRRFNTLNVKQHIAVNSEIVNN